MEITSKVNAVQWHKAGDHPDVQIAGPRYTWSADRQLYYPEGLSQRAGGLATSFWLSTKIAEEPTAEQKKGGVFAPWLLEITKRNGERYWRKGYDFAMWSIKSEASMKRRSGVKIPRFPLNEPLMDVASDDYVDYLLAIRQRDRRQDFSAEDFISYGWYVPDLEAVKADEPKGDVNGRLVVYPGDWLVTHFTGKVEIVGKEDFKKRYPQEV